ncbi:hypothetical protein TVAG_181020 [Trichomonas vaginalis G3]|uniref:Uncharacterized protein n=1 Tax=Trichomonas vaginalis (strain ATCC PRA-98 / G3) TaxID=412133 RepID=A2F3B5_TRIV3|nr:Ankyrin repeat family [Trichomonas vaginalis G3]EAY00624.1 hypothetical protein TVAG_181020 [Trichomonas vaginalis G3]KAI5492656.1 Ankyrin repeat family [Trichomonas vaginalis G3]|eukprot:XP_001313553.1 hypothetical protein [Trichomonas vaginalis G3]
MRDNKNYNSHHNVVDFLTNSNFKNLSYDQAYYFYKDLAREKYPNKLLIASQHAHKDRQAPNGKNFIHIAAEDGNLKFVQFLTECGFNIHVKDKNGETPLSYACIHNHLEVVKYLLSKGADAIVLNNDSSTPLISTAWFGHFEIIKYLLSAGANFKLKNRLNETVYTHASSRGHTEIVKYLASIGANIVPKIIFQLPITTAIFNFELISDERVSDIFVCYFILGNS